MSEIDKDTLYKYYITENMNFKEIAAILGCSWSLVSKYCKKYGFEKTKEQKAESMRKYYMKTIGVPNPALLKSSRDKMKQTMLEKYGVDNIAKRKETVEKRKITCSERYGVANPAQSTVIQDKIKQTNLSKYGVEYAAQNKEIKEKQTKTMLAKYGVEHPLQNKNIKEKQEKTNIEKYGYRNAAMNDEVKNKIRNTNLKKYGFENAASSKEIISKVINTKKERHTFNASSHEDIIYEKLSSKFDVIRQYSSDEYPFCCDFYLPEINLYIEYQGFVTHGGCPFDEQNEEHLQLLEKLREKDTLFYKNIIETWTINDVQKRKTAKQNNLNWLEFFTLEAFNEWFEKCF